MAVLTPLLRSGPSLNKPLARMFNQTYEQVQSTISENLFYDGKRLND